MIIEKILKLIDKFLLKKEAKKFGLTLEQYQQVIKNQKSE